MSEPSAWTTLAHIVRPQGRLGEVLADLLTDFPDQLAGTVSIVHPAGNRNAVEIQSHWLPTGRSAGRIVLKLAGIDTISQAEALTGSEVQIPQEQRVALEDGTYYISDLIGCTLLDGEQALGIVDDVHAALDSTGRKREEAASLLVLRRPDGDEVLIPFANEFIRHIDIVSKRINMALPHGLVELNG